MKLPALEVPDDDDQLAPWLECQLVGMELSDLVSQLSLGRAPADAWSLDTSRVDKALGDKLPAVLQSGLKALSAHELRRLFEQPLLLLRLQDLIFVEGGDYWRGVSASNDHQAAACRVDAAVDRNLAQHTATATPSDVRGRHRLRWIALLAIAASLLMAVGLWSLRPAPAPGWGFDRPGALARQMPANEYLRMLAKAAGEWFNKTPDSAAALRLRLEQFRRGCDTLLTAPHTQLSTADKTWLLDHCRVWRDGIDARLAELNAGKMDLATIRKRADTLVRDAVAALNEQAQLGG